jgi:hypothetical protein
MWGKWFPPRPLGTLVCRLDGSAAARHAAFSRRAELGSGGALEVLVREDSVDSLDHLGPRDARPPSPRADGVTGRRR